MFRKRSSAFGLLSEEGSVVWWTGEGAFPPDEMIEEITLCLSEGDMCKRDLEVCSVRSRADTVSAIVKYAKLDLHNLNEGFCSEVKHFGTLLLQSTDGTEANLCVRLKTRGLAGWTQYSVAWRRIGTDDYACNVESVLAEE